MTQLAIATDKKNQFLISEDQPLISSLSSKGIKASPFIWNQINAPELKTNTILIRSIWDYYLNPNVFYSWLDALDANQIKTFNSSSILRWNANKKYLEEFKSKGLPVVETAWVSTLESIEESLKQIDANLIVLKPSISAGGYLTFCISKQEGDKISKAFHTISSHSEVMVQPFLDEISLNGELSLIYIDNKFSHGVLKKPQTNNFLVQAQYGGSEQLITHPPKEAISLSEKILNTLPGLLYARVDLICIKQCWHLSELELIEPRLFFNLYPKAINTFVNALAQRLN